MGLHPEEGKNLKLTLEDLERMNYKDIAENKADDFHPNLILLDEDRKPPKPGPKSKNFPP